MYKRRKYICISVYNNHESCALQCIIAHFYLIFLSVTTTNLSFLIDYLTNTGTIEGPWESFDIPTVHNAHTPPGVDQFCKAFENATAAAGWSVEPYPPFYSNGHLA